MDLEIIRDCGIIPVVKINDASLAAPLAKALLGGGINVVEITFRTAAAAGAISKIAEQVPDMFVGAGTVLSTGQVIEAKNAGARFLVSPGLSVRVVNAALENRLPIVPGTVTPSEISAGIELGLDVFKFFPAENYGGVNTLKALSAPFGNVSFVPTGGINLSNVENYWKLPCVFAVGGSWMVPEKLIENRDFEEITRISKEAVELMKKVRGGK